MATKKSPNPNPVKSVFVKGGSTKELDLLVMKYDNAEHTYEDKNNEEKTTHFLDAQVTQVGGANSKLKPQVNPHLFTQENNEGKYAGQYNTQVPYFDNQMDAIKDAAGDNAFPINDKDGKQVGTAYAVKSDIMFRKREIDGKSLANGAIINTKSLQPISDDLSKVLHELESDGKGVVQSQFEAVSENIKNLQAEQKAKSEAQAEAPQAENQAEAPQETAEAEADGPEFG